MPEPTVDFGVYVRTDPALPRHAGEDDRLAHLVLEPDWPVALCGAIVKDHLGNRAPGRDRCPACHAIARDRGLGRPAWLERNP